MVRNDYVVAKIQILSVEQLKHWKLFRPLFNIHICLLIYYFTHLSIHCHTKVKKERMISKFIEDIA